MYFKTKIYKYVRDVINKGVKKSFK